MARPEPAEPVKLLAALLWADEAALGRALETMRSLFGEIDFSGPDHPFEVTDYYREEMGPRLLRRLVAFKRLVPPEGLARIKLQSNRVEEELAGAGGRRVNIDTGYLDHCKLVLGSMKFAGQKVCLGDGVWADIICRWKGGRFEYFDWSFPDFRDGRYNGELSAIRRRYLEQLRQWRLDSPAGPGRGAV